MEGEELGVLGHSPGSAACPGRCRARHVQELLDVEKDKRRGLLGAYLCTSDKTQYNTPDETSWPWTLGK